VKMLRLLSFLAVVLGVQSASAPFITPCKSEDNACVMASAIKAVPIFAPGIPELGIKSLDPLALKPVKGDTAGLKLILTDTTVRGMKDCVVEGVKHDLTKMKQGLTIRCTVQLKGNYKLDGQILVLPIRGEGKHIIDIRDIVIKAATDLENTQGEDGKVHWKVKSWKHTYQTRGGAHFDFENLFNGNKILATPVEEFLNSNWQDVMKEVAPPIVKAIVEAVVNDVKALYHAVPAEELMA